MWKGDEVATSLGNLAHSLRPLVLEQMKLRDRRKQIEIQPNSETQIEGGAANGKTVSTESTTGKQKVDEGQNGQNGLFLLFFFFIFVSFSCEWFCFEHDIEMLTHPMDGFFLVLSSIT